MLFATPALSEAWLKNAPLADWIIDALPLAVPAGSRRGPPVSPPDGAYLNCDGGFWVAQPSERRLWPACRRMARTAGLAPAVRRLPSQPAWLAIHRSISGSAAAFTLSFSLIEATAASTGRRASAGMSCSP